MLPHGLANLLVLGSLVLPAAPEVQGITSTDPCLKLLSLPSA